jgi:hypothetical protein
MNEFQEGIDGDNPGYWIHKIVRDDYKVTRTDSSTR